MNRSSFFFELASDLAAPQPDVLAHAATIAGANRELGPLLRMTIPRSFRELTLFDAPVGQPLFRSWVLFAGLVPIDFDHLSFEAIDPGSGFVESSTMLSMTMWRHERRVAANERGGSRLIDRITFTPRIPGTGRLLTWITRALFRHRHARLRTIFGAALSSGGGT
jgi:hypothetical protein